MEDAADDDDRAAAAAGWDGSAHAYIEFQDRGDANRTVLLDPVMLDQCGDVRSARVLDLGCGEGRFCRMLADRGASTVGIDPAAAMTREASLRHGRGAYVRSAAEGLPFVEDTFDLVVSYVTLVDIVRYREAIAEAARVLRRGGRFVVANLGFVTSSAGWLKDSDGARLHHRVDRYADEFSHVYEWAGMRIINWHRPLANYMQAYLSSGLILRDFLEPVPSDAALRDQYQFEDWFRVPEFTVMRWEKRDVR